MPIINHKYRFFVAKHIILYLCQMIHLSVFFMIMEIFILNCFMATYNRYYSFQSFHTFFTFTFCYSLHFSAIRSMFFSLKFHQNENICLHLIVLKNSLKLYCFWFHTRRNFLPIRFL